MDICKYRFSEKPTRPPHPSRVANNGLIFPKAALSMGIVVAALARQHTYISSSLLQQLYRLSRARPSHNAFCHLTFERA